MSQFRLTIVRERMSRGELMTEAAQGFGEMIKAVVDVRRGTMAIGAELHSDEETALMDDGSRQRDLWGINLYPNEPGDDWLEFDSMINVRPAQGNRSRGVEDASIRDVIRTIVTRLVKNDG